MPKMLFEPDQTRCIITRPVAAEVTALGVAFEHASEGASDLLGGIGRVAFQ